MTITFPQGTLPRKAKAEAKAAGATEFRIGQNDAFFTRYTWNHEKGRWQCVVHDSRESEAFPHPFPHGRLV